MDKLPRQIKRLRRGTSILETAIVLSVVVFMAFGFIEFGQYFYIKNCFEAAARDAARVAAISTSTQAQVTATLTSTLSQANVTYTASWLTITDLGPTSSGTVTDVSTVPRGDQIQVRLSTNYSALSNAVRPLHQVTGVGIGATKTVVGQTTIVKE